MLVENKWFAGFATIPFYIVAFLSASMVANNALAYVIFGILILYLGGAIYNNAVILRVKRGHSQLSAAAQWVVAQFILIAVAYAVISLVGTDSWRS